YFFLSTPYHRPQHGPDINSPCENPICQSRLGKRKGKYMYWAALLVGTSEYAEWVEEGTIRVAQAQKREYANVMVVCMCSADGFLQRPTGMMPLKAFPSLRRRRRGSTSPPLVNIHSNPGPKAEKTSRRVYHCLLKPLEHNLTNQEKE